MNNLVRRLSQGTTTRLTLSSPENGNSLSAAMVATLQAAIDTCYEDGTTLLVLEADGRNFCTGFDLSNLDAESDDSLLTRFVRIELLLQALHTAPFLTAALGQGRIVGAGADLFVACRHRVLLGDASMRFPGAAFGLVLGTGRLARLVGPMATGEWVRTGRWVGRDEASIRGLCTACIDVGDVQQLMSGLVAESARLDGVTQQAIHRAMESECNNAIDLRSLIMSAARPGLQQRIRRFRQEAIENTRR